jgi:hypothetical protein
LINQRRLAIIRKPITLQFCAHASFISPQDMIVDSLGFSYIQRSDRPKMWRCKKRSPSCFCTAALTVNADGSITRNAVLHLCQPQPGVGRAKELVRDAKQAAIERPMTSASQIIDEVRISVLCCFCSCFFLFFMSTKRHCHNITSIPGCGFYPTRPQIAYSTPKNSTQP